MEQARRNLKEYAHLAAGGLWTEAFREAMNALTSQGGGTLVVPPGRYGTAPVRLYSNTTLHLEAGAQLVFSDDETLFPLVDLEFEGIPGLAYMPCLYALNADTVRITGSGQVDGSGARWWQRHTSGQLRYPRPYLVCFHHCSNVVMDGVTLTNSPCWTVHPLYCDGVTITNLHILNPPDSPNTDGINPNGSSHVRIAGCEIDVGDDCIAIKAGTEDTPCKRACEHITIEHCRMLHGHGGVVIGSEMSGGVRDVRVTDCVFTGTDRGIRLKTRRGRGGAAAGLTFQNISMQDVLCPFVFNMYYFCGKGGKLPEVRDKAARPVDGGTPMLSDISIEAITVCRATACAGFLFGLPESPVKRVRISDCTVEMTPGKAGQAAMMDDLHDMEAAGLFLRNGEDIDVRGLRILHQTGPALDSDHTVQLTETEVEQ